jgi:hypothetical protein
MEVKEMKKLILSITCIATLFVTMIGTQINVSAAGDKTYLIVEVIDHHSCSGLNNCSAVQEFEVFNGSSKIDYTALQSYDSASKEETYYWNDRIWDKSRLSDGRYNYGDHSSSLFNVTSRPGSKCWSRFALEVNEDFSHIKVWAGKLRIPKKVIVYKTNTYDYDKNLKQKSNEGLTLIGEVNPQITEATVAYSIKNIPIPSSDQQLDIEATSYKVNAGLQFTTNVVIKNAPNLYAEDITVQYDKDKFEYVSAEPADNAALKIYHEDKNTEGKVKFIVASTGASHPLDGDHQILNLKFKAKAVGQGEIKVLSGQTADGAGKEYTPTCLGKTFTVVFGDVNNNGEFTLGDLAIASKLLSTTSDSWGDYHPDVDLNGNVEEVDLSQIVTAILDK